MIIKELMEQVNADRVTEAFMLVNYIFMSDYNELTVAEKFLAIPKMKEIISDNIKLFRECQLNKNAEEYTVFIMYDLDSEDYENKEKKSFSCYAICDKDAYSVLDKTFSLYSDDGEVNLNHYSFDHEKICDIAAYNIAKSSIDKLGMEICAAKILSDIFFWGFYPEDREERVVDLMEKLEESHDESEYISEEEFDKHMAKIDDEMKQAMTDDEKAYYAAKERFDAETEDIVRSYWKKTCIEIEKQHIAAIKEEYRERKH